MEKIITRDNLEENKRYEVLFTSFPEIKEVKIWGKWIYGYFGNSYELYMTINGISIVPKYVIYYIYSHQLYPQLLKVIHQLQKKEEE